MTGCHYFIKKIINIFSVDNIYEMVLVIIN